MEFSHGGDIRQNVNTNNADSSGLASVPEISAQATEESTKVCVSTNVESNSHNSENTSGVSDVNPKVMVEGHTDEEIQHKTAENPQVCLPASTVHDVAELRTSGNTDADIKGGELENVLPQISDGGMTSANAAAAAATAHVEEDTECTSRSIVDVSKLEDISSLSSVAETSAQATEESTMVCATNVEGDSKNTLGASDVNLKVMVEVDIREEIQHDTAENLPRCSPASADDNVEELRTSSNTDVEIKDDGLEKIFPHDSDGGMTLADVAAAETECTSRSAVDVSELEDTFGTDIKDLSVMRSDVHFPPLREDENTIVLYDIEDQKEHPDKVPDPCPCNFNKNSRSRSGRSYVQMPYDTDKWQKICTVLTQINSPIESWKVMEDAIKQYHDYPEALDFSGLEEYFREKDASDEDTLLSRTCLLELIPKIAKLAVDLPNVCTRPVPLLLRQKGFTVAMSQCQAACLLANAFFCTYPPTASYELRDLTFLGLYGQSRYGRSGAQHAKLDCIFNYFRRVTTSMPIGIITFRRQVS